MFGLCWSEFGCFLREMVLNEICKKGKPISACASAQSGQSFPF